jgi:hypothetical protein
MRHLLLAFALLVVGVFTLACSSDFARDINYGTDAGVGWMPPMWDAPGTLPDGGGDDAMASDAGP